MIKTASESERVGIWQDLRAIKTGQWALGDRDLVEIGTLAAEVGDLALVKFVLNQRQRNEDSVLASLNTPPTDSDAISVTTYPPSSRHR